MAAPRFKNFLAWFFSVSIILIPQVFYWGPQIADKVLNKVLDKKTRSSPIVGVPPTEILNHQCSFKLNPPSIELLA